MPNIYWLIAAQRRYLEAMQPQQQPEVWSADYQMIGQRLAATFDDASAVIVRDRLHGYRNHSDRHILLVEVVHRAKDVEPIESQKPASAAPGDEKQTTLRIGWPEFCDSGERPPGQSTVTTAHIVKIAKDRRQRDGTVLSGSDVLAAELGAWERCRPVGMTHDSILMRLRPGARDLDGKLLTILYEDAHHVIGLGQVISLEEAVLDCCVWGSPTEFSLSLLIRSLFERFGADFYNRSQVETDPRQPQEAARVEEVRNLARRVERRNRARPLGPARSPAQPGARSWACCPTSGTT